MNYYQVVVLLLSAACIKHVSRARPLSPGGADHSDSMVSYKARTGFQTSMSVVSTPVLIERLRSKCLNRAIANTLTHAWKVYKNLRRYIVLLCNEALGDDVGLWWRLYIMSYAFAEVSGEVWLPAAGRGSPEPASAPDRSAVSYSAPIYNTVTYTARVSNKQSSYAFRQYM